MATWVSAPPFGTSLKEAIQPGGRFPGPFGAWTDQLVGPDTVIAFQLTNLLVKLAQHMRAESQSLKTSTPAFAEYRRLFAALRKEFDVGVYNLNYDTVALSAWPDAFTGFDHAGQFSARTVHARKDWGFVYHLHGSVHHTLGSDVLSTEIKWERDLNSAFNDGDPGRSRDLRGDKGFPRTTLVAGGFKLEQLLIEPFQSFYGSLIRHVYEADAFLLGGYGFGDVHVNRILQNRLEHANARPPTLVLTWSPSDADPMQFRGPDPWVWNLSQALAVRHEFNVPGHSGPWPMDEIHEKAAFEVSSASRIAVWHGGFVGATERIDVLVPWLAGVGTDHALGPKA